MRIVGIDPGKTGALAHVDLDDMRVLDLIDMPVHESVDGKPITDPRAVYDTMRAWAPDFVVLEHVGPHRRDSALSAWSFGHGFGLLLGACQLAFGDERRVTLHRPASWKAALGLSDDKRQSIEMAREIFPAAVDMLTRISKDDGRAEALLLTEYHRRHVMTQDSVEVF